MWNRWQNYDYHIYWRLKNIPPASLPRKCILVTRLAMSRPSGLKGLKPCLMQPCSHWNLWTGYFMSLTPFVDLKLNMYAWCKIQVTLYMKMAITQFIFKLHIIVWSHLKLSCLLLSILMATFWEKYLFSCDISYHFGNNSYWFTKLTVAYSPDQLDPKLL